MKSLRHKLGDLLMCSVLVLRYLPPLPFEACQLLSSIYGALFAPPKAREM